MQINQLPHLISFFNMVAITIGLPPSAVDHRYDFRINWEPQMPTGIRLPLLNIIEILN